MIRFEKIEHKVLKNTIDEIFKEQDENQFEYPLERNPEEIAIGAYDEKLLIGGIIARKQYQNIHISMLAVNNKYRGQNVGNKLLREVEEIAVKSEVINLTLTTRSYQTVDFYKRAGFTVYATLEDMPMKGMTKYYFNKRLTDLR
ncbi:MAG: GNAT family N-acetyltransferase [Alkalibacterium sp.]|nr:GNAT family N-acetyltransferase [Alkalibacterium sp.]